MIREKERETETGERERKKEKERERKKKEDRQIPNHIKKYKRCHISTEKQTALRADSGLGGASH